MRDCLLKRAHDSVDLRLPGICRNGDFHGLADLISTGPDTLAGLAPAGF
jgi:hypothetical protein